MKTTDERIKALKKYPHLDKPSLMVAATEEQPDIVIGNAHSWWTDTTTTVRNSS